MLSADRSHRLLSLLNQAIQNCKEEEKKLEEQVRQYRDLLKSWKTDGYQDTEEDDKPREVPGLSTGPSAEEIQEVAMLNKALEKAVTVRTGSRPQTAVVRPPADAPTEPPCPFTKKLAKPSISAGKRPVTYRLNPPYKTNPEKKLGRSSNSVAKQKTGMQTPVSIQPAEDRCKGPQEAPGDYKSGNKVTGTSVHPPSNPKVSETQDVREQQHCTLKDTGRSLKLPAEYRRVYVQNNRLWQKFYDLQKQPPSPHPSFIERLQSTFEPGCPRMSLSELQEELARLDGSITRIRTNVDGIEEWKGTGPRDWQDYRLLLVYEALLEEVNDSVSALEPLKQVAEQYVAWDEGHAGDASCDRTRSCTGPPGAARSILHYNQRSDLARLIHCKHRVLELKQRIGLQKVLNKELLSELEARCHHDPESLLLYRAIYTLLCEGGDAFPVLVQEES